MREPSAATNAQTPEQIAAVIEAYLTDFPAAVLSEDGKVLFDFRTARYSLSSEHNRCTLHLWDEGSNLVRRVSAAVPRAKLLRLTTSRFGQTRPATLELAGDRDRRTPSAREATRERYVKLLERALTRHYADEGWLPEAFRTAMDLEKSFGPAYARGLLSRAGQSFAVIGVNQEESSVTIDGILTFGLLWLTHVRESSKRQVAGLKLVLPAGSAALTLARMAWLRDPRQFELLEFVERDEILEPRDATDQGNLATRLQHAPNLQNAKARFAAEAAQVLALIAPASQSRIVEHLRSATELAFLVHGLEFARVRMTASANSFNRVGEITFGAGVRETPLNADTEPMLRELAAGLLERRSPAGDRRDPLFRMQPERWLESNLRRDLPLVDRSLEPEPVYAQVPAFGAVAQGADKGGFDRGMLDLLAADQSGRLTVLEVKAEEDPQLALQGLDYWIRVRWHHAQAADARTGLGAFQSHGYFPGVRLSPLPPRLLLIAPALRIHPATELILRYFDPAVEWALIALDERWRQQIKPVWRKRSSDLSL